MTGKNWTVIVLLAICSALIRTSRRTGTVQAFSPRIPISWVVVRTSRKSRTALPIFYKRRDGELRWKKVPSEFIADVASSQIHIPCSCSLGDGTKTTSELLEIRYIQPKDLDCICDMCYQEYSRGTATLQNFPFQNPGKISDWLDNLTLRPVVDMTMKMKVSSRGTPTDHAILVALIDDTVVGMVEVSQQSIDPERLTSPFPLPKWWKSAEAALKGKDTSLQGWITNLLVAPVFRGRGISKCLVAASENIARKWGLKSMHLHCDAGAQSGKIPQALYFSMGYSRKPKDPTEYAWDRPFIEPSVYLINEVPLLYLQKEL